MNPEEDQGIGNCNESSAYSADSDCVARYGHCAETHAINYFTNFCIEIVGASRSTALTLCGVSMRLDIFGEPPEFSYEWISRSENESDQQKTGILSDPCHNYKARRYGFIIRPRKASTFCFRQGTNF